jgi:cell division protein FtsN
LAQDDYYYEIQLTNKQLVFYFMAGAAGLILSFLAGVMVGRGIDNSVAGGGQNKQIAEERVVAEPTPTPASTEFSYPQRLDSDRPAEGLERPGQAGEAAAPPAGRPTPRPAAAATPVARPAATPTPRPPAAHPAATPPHPAATPRAAAAGSGLPKAIGIGAAVKGFAVQVGAFKDRASAEGVVKSLRGRGLPAFSVAPEGGGLYTVRVGVYRDRADAETVNERLRDDKFKPYIIKQ